MIESESKAAQLVRQFGWQTRPSGEQHLAVQVCPFCASDGYKMAINVSGGEQDGLFHCFKCEEKGNLAQLKQRLGVTTENITSIKDAAYSRSTPPPLPDFKALHWRLMNDPKMGEVLDYLVAERKFSIDVITRYQLGAYEQNGVLWFIIPYFDATGNPVFYKARSVPPAEKMFDAPTGREAPLFNSNVLKSGMEEVVITEGELDTLALLSAGYEPVVGVPGAKTQKATWIDRLDKLAPKVIYTLFDGDKVGQTAAREMATRIGLEKVKNILLPDFTTADGKPGKDINEWLAAGHTLDDLRLLMAEAQPFDVEGVQSLVDVLNEVHSDIVGGNNKGPKYLSPWPRVNERLGGAEDGDLIGIMAEAKCGKTSMSLNWLHFLCEQGNSCLMYCQEMPPKRMVRKWISMATQTDDTPGKSKITVDTVQAAMEIGGSLPGDLLFGFSRSCKLEDVVKTIRQAVRRYGVKVVCFDNLQMLVHSIEHSTNETSRITKTFKALCMELNILMLLIIQPNRVGEGKIVSARNAYGSSAIEKDVDAMICLHRNALAQMTEKDFNGFIETEQALEPQMLVKVDLNRYGPGGCTTLWMDGATSTVRELNADDITGINPVSRGAIPIEAEAVAV